MLGILYPEKFHVMIGFLESATGFALAMGPLIGSILFSLASALGFSKHVAFGATFIF
jgi:hypothetical protein